MKVNIRGKSARPRTLRRVFQLEALERRCLLAADPIINEFVASNRDSLQDAGGGSPDWIEILNAGDMPVDLDTYYLTDDPANLAKWAFPDTASSELGAGQYLIVFASGCVAPGLDCPDAISELHANFTLDADGDYLALVRDDGLGSLEVVSEFGEQGALFPPQRTDIAYGLGRELSTETWIGATSGVNVWLPDGDAYGQSWTGGEEAAFQLAGGLSGWTSGTTLGVGYDANLDYQSLIQTDVIAMRNVTTSAYLRIPISAIDTAGISSLTLRLQYDDGFIAYLNGVEIARDNAPQNATWNSAALGDRPDSSALEFADFDISAAIPSLLAGENLLAIHGLNRTTDSSDFLINAELIATRATGNRTVGYLPTPTPAAVNGPATPGFVADTQFDVDRGFYTSPFQVTITSATPGATIAYTLDGSAPTPSNGAQVPAPDADTPPTATVFVDGTTTLRAAAFKGDLTPANVDTHTYLFVSDIISQPEMDAEIVNNPAYASSIQADLLAIPTVSLVLNNDDMFGPANGIYAHPGGSGSTWERPLSVEFIDPNLDDGFQIDAGIRIHGADARNHQKKPFRLFFRGEYGQANLEYPLFLDSPVSKFDKLVLRGGGHDGWTSPHGPSQSQATSATYLHDSFLRETQADMGNLAVSGRFAHLYINGVYWGLYDIQERPDAAFNAEHLGGDRSDWDVLNTQASVVDGNKTAWSQMMSMANAGLADDAAYEAIQQMLDVDNLIDFMINRIWSGDVDWLRSTNELSSTGNRNKNWYAARNREDGRFQFYVWDAEISMGKNHTSNRNLLLDLTDVDIDDSPGRLYARLRDNAEFRLRFADRLHQHFFNDGAMTQQQNLQRWAALVEGIEQAMVPESARWGDAVRGAPFTRDAEWRSEVEWVADTFLAQRNETVLQDFQAIGLYPAVQAAAFSQHGGQFTEPLQLQISASAGTIYVTSDGSDPRDAQSNGPSAAAAVYGGAFALSETSRIQARVLGGGQWSALTAADFVFADSNGLRITEVMYNPPLAAANEPAADKDEFEFLELQNTGAEPVDLDGVQLGQGVQFDFAAGTVHTLDPGAYVLVVRNQAFFLQRYGNELAGAIAGEFVDSGLNNSGEAIQLIGALGETLQEFRYEDSWYSITDGGGFSLTIRDPLAAKDMWNVAEGWRPSSTLGGSPGAADAGVVPEPDVVVINELLTSSTDVAGDRIELHNQSAGAVDIGWWYLSDDPANPRKYQLPGSTTIEAGGFLVLDQDLTFGIGPNAFELSEHGGQILLTAHDALDNRLGYQTSEEYGASLRDVSFGRYIKSSGRKDFVAMTAQSFGASNGDPRVGPVVINEIMYHPATGRGPEFIELYNLSDTAVLLGSDAVQQVAWKLSGAIEFSFPPNASIEPGGYAVVMQGTDNGDAAAESAAFRNQYGVPANAPLFVYTDQVNGSLSNDTEKLFLSSPGDSGVLPQPYVVVDAVRYDDGIDDPDGWPVQADGGGSALSRLAAAEYGNDILNWTASAVDGSPGRQNQNLDVTPPTTPSGLTSSVLSATTIQLNWNAAEDPQSGISGYQVLRNGQLIAEVESTSFDDTSVQTATAYSYSIVAINGDQVLGDPSPSVEVTILGIESAVAIGNASLTLKFSEKLSTPSAEVAANYQIDGGVTVQSATLAADHRSVTLATSEMVEGTTYTVTVNQVVAESGNQVAPDSQATFRLIAIGEGLVSYWSFDNDFSDQIGSNHATVDAGAPTTSNTLFKQGGGALALDGASNLVTGRFSLGGSFTVAMWIRPQNVSTDWAGFASKNVDSGQKVFWLGQHGTDGQIRFGNYFNLNGETPLDTSVLLSNETWYHIAATWDEAASIQTVYLDGVQVASTSRAGQSQLAGDSVLRIGHSTARQFHGSIDELRLYDRSLSPNEILQLVSPPTDTTPPPAPANLVHTVVGPTTIDFSWDPVDDPETGVSGYQVYRNDQLIGVTDTTAFQDTTAMAGVAYTYQVSAFNGDAVEGPRSQSLQIALIAINSIDILDPNTIQVLFSEPLDAVSAELTSNYQIAPGITVQTATLGGNAQVVTLTTGTLSNEQGYTLLVENLLGVSGNQVAPGTSFAFGSDPLNLGLLSYWPFDADFQDVRGPNDGLVEAGTPTITDADARVGGGALSLDGASNLVTGRFDLGGSFTVAVWIRPDNISTNWAGFASKNVDNGQSVFWLGQHGTDGRIRFGNYFNLGAEAPLDTPVLISNGNWYHVAATWDEDAGTQTVYLDGTLVASSDRLGQSQLSGNSVLRIGHSTASRFDGLIDDLRIYERALGPADIGRLANPGQAVSPVVQAVTVNGAETNPANLPGGAAPTDWQTQRSDVRSLVVRFSSEVVVAASDLQFTNLGIDAPVDPDQTIELSDDQLTMVGNELTIRFNEGQLSDGVFRFEIMPTVTDLAGHALDGNADGVGGDPFVLQGDSDNHFHQRVADWNGDGGVTIFDFPTFAYWFGQSLPTAPSYVDLNADDGVTIFDFPEFAAQFGQGVVYPPPPLSSGVASPSRAATAALGGLAGDLERRGSGRILARQMPGERANQASDAALLAILAEWRVGDERERLRVPARVVRAERAAAEEGVGDILDSTV